MSIKKSSKYKTVGPYINKREFSFQAVRAELEYAEKKFPKWPKDLIYAAAILQEESGETVKAALEYAFENGDIDAVLNEATQTAAMAIRLMEHIDEYYDGQEYKDQFDLIQKSKDKYLKKIERLSNEDK